MSAETAHPWHLSWAWLRQLAERVKRGLSEHHIAIVAGALAYQAMLAVFPALIALVSTYGLVSSPEAVARQVETMGSALPEAGRQVLRAFLQNLVQTRGGQLSGALVIGIVLALWSASSGMATVVQAISIAYDEPNARGIVRERALALGLTVGAIVIAIVDIFGIAVLPALASRIRGPIGDALLVARWFVLGLLVWFALSALYRIVPRRAKPSLEGVSLGATAATLLWVGGSLLFSLFVSHFGKFGAIYGPLAGVIVLMLWFYLSGFVLLIGAELAAESRG
jgi:membrane protein